MGDINIVLPCASSQLLSEPVDHTVAPPLNLIVCLSNCSLASAAGAHRHLTPTLGLCFTLLLFKGCPQEEHWGLILCYGTTQCDM